jgi:hypothetical protein
LPHDGSETREHPKQRRDAKSLVGRDPLQPPLDGPVRAGLLTLDAIDREEARVVEVRRDVLVAGRQRMRATVVVDRESQPARLEVGVSEVVMDDRIVDALGQDRWNDFTASA